MAGVCRARFTTFGTLPVSLNSLHDAHRFRGDRFLRLVCRSADVMRAVESFFFDDLIVKLAGAARWLDGINVQTRANAAIPHRCDQRLLIDNFAARSVDEVSAFPHRVEKVSVDEVSGFRIQCEMNADDVRRGGDFFRRLPSTQHRAPPRAPAVKLLLHATTGIPNARARGIISCPILPTPINPSVRPNNPRAFENSFLFHSPRRKRDDVVGDASIECEDQSKGEFGNGDRVFAGTVRNVNAALRSGGTSIVL